MAIFSKLPNELRGWKINSVVSENKNNKIYKITKKDFDGSEIKAVLKHISLQGEDYTVDDAEFLRKEADFLKKISQISNLSYIDVFANNEPAKNRAELYIVTEDLHPLSEIIKTQSFSTEEIVDFGIQISAIIESLESKGVFHGNLTPENIFVTPNGKYKLGGFSDYESKISDMSFIAPEIFRKENADFTTDIYSLGLIMYYMSNNHKLPFENEQNSSEKATEIRLSGKSLPAPQGENEKLKSVIVIACQPNNANRWKNAGNIKNALTSIRSELPKKSPEEQPKIIVPEPTGFEENVFEEYDFEAPVEPVAEEVSQDIPLEDNNNADFEQVEPEENAENQTVNGENNAQENGFEVTTPDEDVKAESNPSNSFETVEVETLDGNNYTADPKNSDGNTNNSDFAPDKADSLSEKQLETEIDEDIFDNFEVTKRPNSYAKTFENKDYGDYFNDDEEEQSVSKEIKKEEPNKIEDKPSSDIPAPIKPKSTHGKPLSANTEQDNFDREDDSSVDIFSSEPEFEDTDSKNSKSKKNTAIIIVCIIVMLSALGFIAFCVISGITGNESPTESTESTPSTEATTVPTTEPTTVPTTEPTKPKVDVIPVVGYGYYYAVDLLEAEGFTVEVGKYLYSDTYDEGYVISQTPNGDTKAEKGSVITLDVSLGPEESTEETTEETTEPTQETTEPTTVEKAQNKPSSNYYILPNSSTENLNKSQVKALSNNELNLAINEVYARNGRIFSTASIAEYFNSQSWYQPKYSAAEFDKNVNLNEYEQYNLKLLIAEQTARGLR